MPDAQFTLKFDFIAPGRLPLMWCLIAFIVTFLVTRLIVRYIRANADNTSPRKWWQPRTCRSAAPPAADSTCTTW